MATEVNSSGITVAPAKGTKRRDEEAKGAPKASWSAAALPSGPWPSLVSASVGVQRPKPETEAFMNTNEDAERPHEEQPAAQRRRVLVNPMLRAEHFGNIDCGGDGDCGFLAFAPRQGEDKKKKTPLDNFKPKGPVQAELRLLSAGELEKNNGHYLFEKAADATSYAKKVGKAGFYADSRSMVALAQAAQVDVRIWACADAYSRWDLYRFQPWES